MTPQYRVILALLPLALGCGKHDELPVGAVQVLEKQGFVASSDPASLARDADLREQLVGIWRHSANPQLRIDFRKDGTIVGKGIAKTEPDAAAEARDFRGRWNVINSVLVLDPTPNDSGPARRLRIEYLDDQRLRLVDASNAGSEPTEYAREQ